MFGYILLAIGLVIVLTIRLVRWVALVQQKEYRPDRLRLFLATQEGTQELWRIGALSDFTRTGLKRPKLTLRSIATLIASGVVILFLVLVIVISVPLVVLNKVALVALCVYLLIPPTTMLVGAAPGFLFRIYTQRKLVQAGKLLRQQQPVIIGITGSYGKTATKLLLAHVLQQKYSVFIPPRSHNTVLSISRSVIASYTRQEVAVIEYAAYKSGEIARLARQIPPAFAILTGLTEQHLGLFGSLTDIKKAKSELLHALPADAPVYCANPAALEIASYAKVPEKRLIKTWLDTTITGKQGDAGQLIIKVGTTTVETEVVGKQYLETIRSVWSVAAQLGVTKQQFIQAVQSFEVPSGFTKTYTTKQGFRVLDDGGTSNPTGFAATLQTAKEISARRKILITSGIVDLGERSAAIHTKLATQAKSVVDEVWCVGAAGLDEFESVCSEAVTTDQSEILTKLTALSATDLVIIEGRMPAWIMNSL